MSGWPQRTRATPPGSGTPSISHNKLGDVAMAAGDTAPEAKTDPRPAMTRPKLSEDTGED